MRRRLRLFALLFVLNSLCQAQNTEAADSIYNSISELPVDKKLNALSHEMGEKSLGPYNQKKLAEYQIALARQEKSYDFLTEAVWKKMEIHTITFGQALESLAVYEKYENEIEKAIDPLTLARLYNIVGRSRLYSGDAKSSIEDFQKAATFEIQDPILKGDIINNKSIAYGEIGQLAKAAKNSNQAIEIYKKGKDTIGMITALASIGSFYTRAGFYDQFHEVNDEAIALAEEKNSYRNLLGLYFNQATTYMKMEMPAKRVQSLYKSLKASQKFEGRDFIEPRILMTYISALLVNNEMDKARQYLDTLRSRPSFYIEKAPDDFQYSFLMGQFAFAKANYEKAAPLLKEQVDEFLKGQDYDNQLYALKVLADTYEKLNDTDAQLKTLKTYHSIKDSINAKQNRNALLYYQTLYETEKRDGIIQEREKEIDQLDAEIELQQLYYLIGLLILLLIAGGIFYWRFRRSQREKQQLQRSFTQDIINSVEMERKRISHELHDSIGNSLLLIRNRLTTDTQNSKLIEATIEEVRDMSHRMHPYNFEKQGILESIETLVNDLQDSSDVFYSFETDLEKVDIAPIKNIQVYRIIQEAVSNVEKHAGATACQISVEQQQANYIFTIKDNGKGLPSLDKVDRGLGLRSMEERAQNIAATLHLEGRENEGTSIRLVV